MADENIDDMPLAAAGEKASTPNPLIPLIVAVVLSIGGAFALFMFVIEPAMAKNISEQVTGHSPQHEEEAIKSLENMGRYEVNEVTTNLAGLSQKYIRVSFTLEGSNPHFKDVVEKNHARVMDAVLSVLQSLSVQEARQAGIKNIVGGALVGAINKSLEPAPHVVEGVYFTEFVIQ